MKSAIARQLPRLEATPIDDSRTLHVACYGPSLRETWQDLRHPILSMSGATKWLAERGVVADYHIDMDPRPNKVKDVTPPVPGVRYLIASVCCPGVFDALVGEDVTLWHAVSSNERDDTEWLETHDPHQWLVTAHSTIGLAALQIGGLLGYRHFEVHGMDGSFGRDGVRHAGPHTDPKRQPDDITWAAGGVTYRTSKIMANAVAETLNAMQLYPLFAVFHGDGLTQALIREQQSPNACHADELERAAVIRRARASFLPVPAIDRKKIRTWSPWEAICFSEPDPAWLEQLQVEFAIADARRPLARFNTGSISLETGLLLRALGDWKKPRVVVEVGTFIGKSTVALAAAAERLYTCDKDNDCLPATERIVTHPYTTSTAMLRRLAGDGVKADLFFLDGRLTDEDVALVRELSRPDTVFAFDDFHAGGKGEANVRKLGPHLPRHGFVEPYPAFANRTTLALLVPLEAAA